MSSSNEEAIKYLKQVMVDKIFGEAGEEVVIEERLVGEELSVLAFCDGENFHMMPSAQDHKRIFDNDQGPKLIYHCDGVQGIPKQGNNWIPNLRVSKYVNLARIIKLTTQ